MSYLETSYNSATTRALVVPVPRMEKGSSLLWHFVVKQQLTNFLYIPVYTLITSRVRQSNCLFTYICSFTVEWVWEHSTCIDRKMDDCIIQAFGKCIHGHLYECMDIYMVACVDMCLGVCLDAWIPVWMSVCLTDVCMDRCMYVWMVAWMPAFMEAWTYVDRISGV